MTVLSQTFRSGRASRGVAAIEFALVLPMLALLILGMLDYGWFFFVEHAADTAAREGARAATLYPGACGTTGSDAAAVDAATQCMGNVGQAANTLVAVTCATVGGDPQYQVDVKVLFPQLTGYSLIPMPREAGKVRAFARVTMRGVP